VTEGVSCASWPPWGSLGRGNFVGLLSLGGGETAARVRSAVRCWETGATLWGTRLEGVDETLMRIGIAKITPAAIETGTTAGLMESRTARTTSTGEA
jgi:hypothetical protein